MADDDVPRLVPPEAPKNAPTPPNPGEPINWRDPCARADALSDAYNRLVSGSQESEVTYQANSVTRRVRYQAANLDRLLNAIREAENECAIQEGRQPARRRFAIIGGSRRIFW